MAEPAAFALPGDKSFIPQAPSQRRSADTPTGNSLIQLDNPYKIRGALAVCAFPAAGAGTQSWANLCIDVLNTAADRGQLGEFPKIVLALRGQNPERPRGLLNATNLAAIVTDTILKEGKGTDAIVICTPEQGPLCPRITSSYTHEQFSRVLGTGGIVPLTGANPSAATVFGPPGAAVIGFVDGYVNPERYRLKGLDGQSLSVAQTVAQYRITNPDHVVRNKLASCFRVDEGREPDACASAGVRAGMYRRISNK